MLMCTRSGYIFTVGPTLYKSYTNVLCLLGDTIITIDTIVLDLSQNGYDYLQFVKIVSLLQRYKCI